MPSSSARLGTTPGPAAAARPAHIGVGACRECPGDRFAARLLLKDKWFTFVAAVALALGIGVNATVFTFVNAVLIRGLPIADPDRTLTVGSYNRARSNPLGVSYLDYRDWKENTKTFETFGAYNGTVANVSDEGQPPERFNGSHISANGLAILGTTPVLGRNFVADDERQRLSASSPTCGNAISSFRIPTRSPTCRSGPTRVVS